MYLSILDHSTTPLRNRQGGAKRGPKNSYARVAAASQNKANDEFVLVGMSPTTGSAGNDFCSSEQGNLLRGIVNILFP